MRSDPTLKDVGRAAGVSAMTASRVLNGATNVSSATRARVQNAACQLGYQMNVVASALSKRRGARPQVEEAKRVETVACIFGNEEADPMSERSTHSHREIWQGFQERTRKLGIRPELFWYFAPRYETSGLQSVLDDRKIRSAVIFGTSDQAQLDLAWDRMACVWATRPHNGTDLSFCDFDRFSAVAIALKKIALAGRSRPGLICFDEHSPPNRPQLAAGFHDTVARAWPHQTSIPPLILDGHLTDEKLAFEIQKWIARTKPGAILSPGKRLSQLIAAQHSVSFNRVPVIDLELDQSEATDLNVGIIHPYVQMGATAVDLVASQLAVNQLGVPEHSLAVTHQPRWHGQL